MRNVAVATGWINKNKLKLYIYIFFFIYLVLVNYNNPGWPLTPKNTFV